MLNSNEFQGWQDYQHQFSVKTIGLDGHALTISGCAPEDAVFVVTSHAPQKSQSQDNITGYMKRVGDHHLEYAIRLHQAGLIPFNCNGKKPAILDQFSRKSLYTTPWTMEKLNQAFLSSKTSSISLLLGPVSKDNDLVALDFEVPGMLEDFFRVLEKRNPVLYKLIQDSYTERTKNGGHHILLWVPQNAVMGRTPLVLDENGELIIEILGGKNSYMVISPSPSYKAFGPLLDENGHPKISSLIAEDLSEVLEICRGFKGLTDLTTVATPLAKSPHDANVSNKKTSSPQAFSGNKGGVGKAERAERYLLTEGGGWRRQLERFGYTIVCSEGDLIRACHPNSTNLNDPNCAAGPKASGKGNTFVSWSSKWLIGHGSPLKIINFIKAHVKDAKAELAKIFTEVENAWGPLEDPALKDFDLFGDEFRSTTDCHGINSTEPHCQNDSSLSDKHQRLARERKRAVDIDKKLQSPCAGNLLNLWGEEVRQSSPSKHAPMITPYATGIAYIGHWAARWLEYKGSRPVVHLLILANTSYGKEHPRNMSSLVAKEVVILQKRHEKKYGSKDGGLPSDGEKGDKPLTDDQLLYTGQRRQKKPKKRPFEGIFQPEKKDAQAQEIKQKSRWKNWEKAVINPGASKQGIEDSLSYCTHAILEINEFGDFFKLSKKANGNGGTADRLDEIVDFFKQLFDCPLSYRMRSKAGKKPRWIRYLRPSLIAYSTPEGFIKHLGPDDLESGRFNRILTFRAGPKWMTDDYENLNRPEARFGEKEVAKKLAAEKFKREKFYALEIGVKKTKISESEGFTKAFEDYEKKCIMKELQDELNQTANEGITGRGGQYIRRLALVHLYGRMGMVLEKVDFDWALGVVEVSQECQFEMVRELRRKAGAGKAGAWNPSREDESIKKIRRTIINLHRKGETITCGKLANQAFKNIAGKEKVADKEGFRKEYEPILINLGLIIVNENGHYKPTPKCLNFQEGEG